MPRWILQLRLILRTLSRRQRVDRELDEEIQDHLQREIDAQSSSGLPPEEARYAALRVLDCPLRQGWRIRHHR